MQTKTLDRLTDRESFQLDGEQYLKLKNTSDEMSLCLRYKDGSEKLIPANTIITPAPGTSLGQIPDGSSFRFGGVTFRRNFLSNDGSDELVSCWIGDSTKTVHISVSAWVEIL